MGQKSAFQAALAPPRGDFFADVARLLPVPDRDFRLDFCGEGPRLYGVSLDTVSSARRGPPQKGPQRPSRALKVHKVHNR